MKVFWFLPTHGDSRYLGTSKGGRIVDQKYLAQIARAADELGFEGALIPVGRSCEDPWVAAATLIPETKRLKFLIALRPGIVSPTVAARMSSTFDRFSNGRLLVNLVTGGDPVELASDGSWLRHDERYEAADEFLKIWRGVTAGESVTLEGKHIHVEDARLLYPPVQTPHPPIYFGGSSAAAHELAADHVDVYLTWGEPPAAVAEKIADIRARAENRGRKIRFGIRLHVIVRETSEEAWAAADELIRYVDEDTIASAQQAYSRMDSEGQRRMAALNGGSKDNLEVYPNLWAGVGLVRGGAGTAMVGSPEEVARLMQEYTDIGIETFILSGYPHLEEAYRVAELLFPILPIEKQEGLTGSGVTGPFGEIIGNHFVPPAAANSVDQATSSS